MYILNIFDEALVGIQLFVVTQLYKVAANVFKIFMILAQSDFLEEIDYGTLLSNFYVIIGLVMLFIMAFALLRGIINPDDQKQGATVIKTIIVNFVISCVLLGFLPTIFPFMFDLQDSILRYNVIGGFFGFGRPGTKLEDFENINEVEASSYRMVNGVFTAFFNVSTSFCNDVETDSDNRYENLITCQKSLHASDTLKINGHEVTDSDGDNDSFYLYNKHVDGTGDFGVYANFIEAASNNQIDFGFFMSLVAGIMLIYVGISYCFDMALRLIKLIFYQAIAPIPIFLRIVPNSKFSGTFNQWLKVTLTCWMEVFVRIFIFNFCMWLCRAMQSTDFMSKDVYNYGFFTGLITQAFILMAIVTFMKRSPKLLSEVTGIDSGNMKLGIREKIAEGGGFVAGAAVGGLATAGFRNTIGAVRRTKENYKEAVKDNASGLKKAGIIMKGIGGGILSTIGGAGSGAVRSGKRAVGKKTFGDTGSAITSGATAAVKKSVERHNYTAQHGGIIKSMGAHAEDAVRGVGAYFGVGASDASVNIYRTAASTTDTGWSVVKGGWEGKKVYQDQEAIVKALKSDMNAYTKFQNRSNSIDEELKNVTQGSEQWNNLMTEKNNIQNRMQGILSNYDDSLDELRGKIATEDAKLKSIRLDLSKSKTDVLATEATKYGDDQIKNYLNDKELADSFRSNLLEAFGAKTLTSDGKFLNANNEEIKMAENEVKIINAMLSGKAIEKAWLDTDDMESAYKLQEAMDKINNGRLGIRGKHEREYIVSSRNKSSENKDSGK